MGFTLAPVAVVAPDGTFRATGTRIEQFGPTEQRRSGGSFSERLRGTGKIGRYVARVSTRFAGTIGALGARGTYRHDARLVNPRTGRTRESCTLASTVRWTAAP